ncbi:MAG: F0F1 ATP synthase subunit A [Streptosporangiaceae bacterium]
MSNTSLYFIFSILFFFLIFYFSFYNSTNEKDKTTYNLLNNKYIFTICNIYNILQAHFLDIITIKGQKYIPLILNLFLFILLNNLIGLIPYSFTTTSQIIITFGFSCSIIIGITILGISIHKSKFLNIFMPSGIPKYILPLIFIIEILSYLSRIISLSIRLTANMVAGHTILNIIASFAVYFSIFNKIILFLPILFLLLVLEIGVALIQAYVFSVLSLTYIKDILILH